MKLIIVESPHKSKTIAGFLSSDYKVLASKGHIRDLASVGKMRLGVDVDHNFKPTYEIKSDSRTTVKELQKAVDEADEVLLATDPDREGEAIAWHLYEVLNLKNKPTCRLEFHEITKNAIKKAIEDKKQINMPLVESQETRRIIDRIMGYRLSYLLQKKIKSPSAGRVQSVVLKFIVDREKEIDNFKSKEYWTIDGLFSNDQKISLNADLFSYNGVKYYKGSKDENENESEDKNSLIIASEQEALDTISKMPKEFKVSSCDSKMVSRYPLPPFITSTLQQDAFSKCGFSTKRTAAIAQRLYEGVEVDGQSVGLITYMRTDSVRLSDEFVQAANKYIIANYGKEYLGHVQIQKEAKNVQDAHEAIRPTDISLTPESIKKYLANDEYRLYSLIYNRAIASLMNARINEIRTIILNGNGYEFKTTSTKTVFDGYSKVYKKDDEEDDKKQLPSDIQIGSIFNVEQLEKTQHFTLPPARYNEGRLVKEMKDKGVGRPSTYASTIDNLISKGHIESKKEKGKQSFLYSTPQGRLTVERLEKYFPKYMDVQYTAKMESDLDDISLKTTNRDELLSSFWSEFKTLFDEANGTMEGLPVVIIEGEFCPKCGKPLVRRKSRFGEYTTCQDYPTCDFVLKKKQDIIEGRLCPKCGKPLARRKSLKGEFIGCTGYPTCTYKETLDGVEIVPEEKKPLVIPDDAPVCPQCKVGRLIERKSRYGTTFIGCSNYPACHYIQKDENAKKTSGKRYYKKKK